MPELDVSDIVNDAMLADSFTVTRRATVVDAKGRTTTTQQVLDDLVGVVTQQDPSDLMRRDDGQMVPRQIFVASSFAFRGASAGFQPDVVTWAGTDYTVKQVYPYSRYGDGITEVVAESQQAVDAPQ